MAKQKCGTCRFFQDAGLAGSGWCHHPQRKVSSGVMIMVRQNELACRDEWSRSLWAPAQDAGDTGASFQRPSLLGPAKPLHLENVRKLLATQDPAQMDPAHGEDVLLSEGRIVTEFFEAPRAPERVPKVVERPMPAATPESDRPVNGSGFDARSAVFRAREAYRERTRAKEAAARVSAGAAAVSSSLNGAATLSTPTLLASESPGERADPNAHEAATIESANVARSHVSANADEPRAYGGWDEPYSPAGAIERGAPEQSSRVEADQFVEPPSPATVADDVADVDVSAEQDDLWEEHLPLAGIVESVDLPSWFRQDLPRTCRNCRDFRPSAEGERGWCANTWAFTHRRMVQQDDAAPCESSIGDWWVPFDDVWLVAADVSNHGRATPLLDRLIAPQVDRRKRS